MRIRLVEVVATAVAVFAVGTGNLSAQTDFLAEPSCCLHALEAACDAFEAAGGTGALENATGAGTFHFALNETACNGLVQPAHVWFEGQLEIGE